MLKEFDLYLLSLSTHSQEGCQLQPVVDPSQQEWVLLSVLTCLLFFAWLSSSFLNLHILLWSQTTTLNGYRSCDPVTGVAS